MKNWNWALFVVVLCIAEIGAIGNDSVDSIAQQLIFGLIMGVIFGIPLAYLTREK